MSEAPNYLSQIYSAEIEADENNEIKDELIDNLHEAEDILRYFKKEYWEGSLEYSAVLNDYNELKQVTIESVQSEIRITQWELISIKNELKDITDQENFLEERIRKLSQYWESSKENGKYWKTLLRIEWSKSNEKTENRIHGILTESQQYLNGAKWTEFFDDTNELYNYLDSYINETLDNDRTFDYEEITSIEQRYYKLLTFTKENNIQQKGLPVGEKRLEKHRITEKNTLLKWKDVNDNIPEAELKGMLKIIQENYNEYTWSDFIDKWINILSSTNTIFEIKTKLWARELQDTIIEKLLWNEKWYNNTDIKIFDSEKGWNNIVNIWEFENTINSSTDIQKINRLWLINYIKYLQVSNSFNYNVLINKFWWEKAAELINLLEKDWEFKESFESKNDWFLDKITSAFTSFIDELFEGDFIKKFQTKNAKEQEAEILALREFNEEEKARFTKNQAEILWIEISEAQEMVEKLLSTRDMNLVLKILMEYGTKEEDVKETISDYSKIVSTDNKIKEAEYLHKITKWILTVQEEIEHKNSKKINQEFADKLELFEELSAPDIMNIAIDVQNWGTFEENIEELRKENKWLNQLLEEQELEKKEKINKEIREIDNQDIDENIYQDYTLDENTEIPRIEKSNWAIIEITPSEAKTIKDNPDALKNLIDTKEKLDILGLDFIWTYRKDYIDTMKSTPWFMDIKMDIWDDFINPEEFNNLLKFTLTLLWENPANSYSWNLSKIVRISSVSETDNKTDFVTWYGKIWTQLHEMWYIWESSIDTNNITNMQNYKQTIKNYKIKK